jgi:hypothetical protein
MGEGHGLVSTGKALRARRERREYLALLSLTPYMTLNGVRCSRCVFVPCAKATSISIRYRVAYKYKHSTLHYQMAPN